MNRLMTLTLFVAGIAGCSTDDPLDVLTKGSRACALALAPHAGDEPLDEEIRRQQLLVGRGEQRVAHLERLGWAYVVKARQSFDPGFYSVAEQVAACIAADESDLPEELLLRGHLLHQYHRFQEAETLARKLVGARGLAHDQALLGDLLLEQGKLEQAALAYQEMMRLRPGPQAYSRAAQLRWLRGDLDGALELMEMAVAGAGTRDREAAAWLWVRFALFELQKGREPRAERQLTTALTLVPSYPPALLARGRLFLAHGRVAEALEALERAREQNPLPEYDWALIEGLEASGRRDRAEALRSELVRGKVEDRRTLGLFLATRREQTPRALELVKRELEERQDIFTLDALAWSLFAEGETNEARRVMERALSAGTEDARLHYHAAVIAAAAGGREEARRFLARARQSSSLLWPSERGELERLAEDLDTSPSALG